MILRSLLFLAALVLSQASQAQIPSSRRGVPLAPPPASSTAPFNYLAPVIGEDDYPAYALEMGVSGTSVIRGVAARDGRVMQCETVSSAGLAILDEQACRIYRERGRFALREGLQHAAFQARVRWELGEPIAFNMFALLEGFDSFYSDLRPGEAVPGALRERELRHCFPGGEAAEQRQCRLPRAPRRSWLAPDLAREPSVLTLRHGRAEALSFRIDGGRRILVRNILTGRLGSPCSDTARETIWCAPAGWAAVLAGNAVSIERRAAPSGRP
jgi:hypothetical protein